jgi:hypothetical protein
VSLTVTDNKNAKSVIKTISIDVHPVNQLPNAILDVSKKKVEVKKKITYDASNSADPDGYIESYLFDFGDGTNSSWINSSTITHAYDSVGKFKVSVSVKDNRSGIVKSEIFEIEVKKKEEQGFLPGFGISALLIVLILFVRLKHFIVRCK